MIERLKQTGFTTAVRRMFGNPMCFGLLKIFQKGESYESLDTVAKASNPYTKQAWTVLVEFAKAVQEVDALYREKTK